MAEVRKSEHEGGFGEKKREQQKKNYAELIQEYHDSSLYLQNHFAVQGTYLLLSSGKMYTCNGPIATERKLGDLGKIV